MRTPWNPNVPHCFEEARILGPDGRDGGGHSSCMTELSADGTCPKAGFHHAAYVAWGRAWRDAGGGCHPDYGHRGGCTCKGRVPEGDFPSPFPV